MLLYEDPKISKYKSKLKKVRLIKGYTQEAYVSTIYRLCIALGCEIEDILNKEEINNL